MNDEIKEILEKLKDREETYQFCKQYKLTINDSIYEVHYLLDYITNLQKNNDNQMKYIADLLVQITNLQQENDGLKNDLENEVADNKLRLEELTTMVRDDERSQETIIRLTKENKDYKSRCEKAIGYINKYCIDDEFYINLSNKEKAIIEVLNILQNGSDSQ